MGGAGVEDIGGEELLKSISLEIVRLGIPRLGTWRKQTQGFYEKVIWPPMALRIGLLRSSALQNDGLDVPVILQFRTPRETNPKGHWGPKYFLGKSIMNAFRLSLNAWERACVMGGVRTKW